MENQTRSVFQPLFEKRLHLLKNPSCKQCDAKIRQPLLPWLVGNNYAHIGQKTLFVGKPHRGYLDEILGSGIIDPTNVVESVLWDKRWPYWSYTREIAENIYGVQAADYIALTNIIKCTNVSVDETARDSMDKTTRSMAQQCLLKQGVVWKEIECLKPTNIIFYTYNLFREMLDDVPIALAGTIKTITERDHTVACRNKRLGWWERKCRTLWSDKVRILVVGHPERMGRPEYVKMITTWLRSQ